MKVALLTSENLDGYILDEERLVSGIKDKGWDCQWVQWDDSSVNWNNFDFAIIRTTWDYCQRLSEYLEALKKIEESSCQLLNKYKMVCWNSDKKYLKELEGGGVAIVPTLWRDSLVKEEVLSLYDHWSTSRLVVKPNVSAGASSTYLLNKDDDLWGLAQQDLKGVEVMVQPFLVNVAEEGEYSLHFFDNQFSHGILKKPKTGDFRSQEEFGSSINEINPSRELLSFADNVLGQLEEKPLYARVDIIKGNDLNYNLIELELIEPSLYFRYNEKAASRFVEALANRV